MKYHLLIIFILFETLSFGQGYQMFIANDQLTAPNVFEFDVFMKDTSLLASPNDQFLVRTVQQVFTINPAFTPAGTPSISITSSGLNYYPPGLFAYNANPSLSAFQVGTNATGTCTSQGPILHSGDQVLISHWKIQYPAGTNFNCVAHNLSMVRPNETTLPGGNVNLRFTVTKWATTNCNTATSIPISNNGLYTSQAGGTLISQMNNSVPKITNPVNVTTDECSQNITFSVTTTSSTGSTAAVTYQWRENGVPLTNIPPYSGVNTSQLTILQPSIAMNQNAYSVVVTQCNSRTSSSAILTVNACAPKIDLNVSVFIEGFYIQNGQMNASVDPVNHSQLSDTLIVELRDHNSPYSVLYSDTGTLNIYGFSAFQYPNTALNNSYYIAVHHRNSVETWSASPVLFNTTITNYSFTNAANKAYGNNLKNLGDGNFAMWSGDFVDAVTNIIGKQDGVIESSDYAQMEIAVYYVYSGYVPEDITGDRLVESADYDIMETNVYYTRFTMRP